MKPAKWHIATSRIQLIQPSGKGMLTSNTSTKLFIN